MRLRDDLGGPLLALSRVRACGGGWGLKRRGLEGDNCNRFYSRLDGEPSSPQAYIARGSTAATITLCGNHGQVCRGCLPLFLPFGHPPSFPFAREDRFLALEVIEPRSAAGLMGLWQWGQVICAPLLSMLFQDTIPCHQQAVAPCLLFRFL